MFLDTLLHSQSYINILIGENGHGKTRLLDKIAKNARKKNDNAIIINNARCKNLTRTSSNYLIPSNNGEDFNKVINKLIKDSFFLIQNNEYIKIESKFRQLAKVLNYLGYDQSLVFSVKKDLFERDFFMHDNFDGDYTEAHLVSSLLEYLHIVSDDSENKYICVDLNEDLFGGLENSIKFLYLIKYYWKEKYTTHLISSKTRYILEFNYLSSGERNILLAILFIISSLSENKKNILIIDEPEVSLHPKWQIEYLEKINDLFYLSNTKIYIATHSPLILTDLFFQREEKISINHSIFHVENSNIKLIENDDEKSIESIYWNIFGILTPQSSFLSRKITEMLNELTRGKLSIEQVINTINIYIKSSYDKNQINLLNKLKSEIKEKSNFINGAN